MDLFSGAEKMLAMDEAVWMRHANPWSVWSRFLTCVPLLSLAVWSRAWLGWYSLLPIGLALFWIWYNPRAFPVPARRDNWASKGVFGERIFLERRKTDLPSHHLRTAQVLMAFSFVGAVLWIFGLATLNAWATVAGIIGVNLPKAWFVDRMVWIYEDMKDADPKYAAWLGAPASQQTGASSPRDEMM